MVIFMSPKRTPLGCLDDRGVKRQCDLCSGCDTRRLPVQPRPARKPLRGRS